MMSIKSLNLVEPRFFGIVSGLKDYYVIEAKNEASEEAPAGMDAPGTGVNSFCYFVSNSVYGPFEKLPNISAEIIASSRNIQRLFTGNLRQKLGGYPTLATDGMNQEKYLLRAQLARISAATVIAPFASYQNSIKIC